MPPRRDEVCELAYRSLVCKDTGKNNSSDNVHQLPKAKVWDSERRRSSGDRRQKGSSRSFHLLLL